MHKDTYDQEAYFLESFFLKKSCFEGGVLFVAVVGDLIRWYVPPHSFWCFSNHQSAFWGGLFIARFTIP